MFEISRRPKPSRAISGERHFVRIGCGNQFPRNSSRVSSAPSQRKVSEQPHAFSLTVLFTTVSDTMQAPRKGAELARDLGSCIRILVPHVVPYPLPIGRPFVSVEFSLRNLRTLCGKERIATQIDVRLCRDTRQCVHATLLPQSLVLIGGHQSRWPLTLANGLAGGLKRTGHDVVFVDNRRQR